MGDSDQLRPVSDHPFEHLNFEFALLIHQDHFKRGSFLFGKHLPGYQVGMMLHLGKDDLVASVDILSSIGLCHQVYGFGGAFREDDLMCLGGIDEFLNCFPCIFIGFRRLVAQVMNAAVDIAIFLFVIAHQPVDYLTRFLGGCSVIEINQGFVAHDHIQDWKIMPYMKDVKTHNGLF